MTQRALTEYNLCQSLDDLMNLDPRGYGVCRILYAASRAVAGEPTTLAAGRALCAALANGGIAHIITGFVLPANRCGEMDGIVGSAMLARALARACGAKSLLAVPDECLDAMRAVLRVAGLHVYGDVEAMLRFPNSACVVAISKDAATAAEQAASLAAACRPAAAIAVEAPGANAKGVYHNAVGLDVTELEAKSDALFIHLQSLGVPTFAIGDLGNEIGMGAIGEALLRRVPRAAPGRCGCPCGGGIAAATAADHLITATASDWGAYALAAAIALLSGAPDALHDESLERRALIAASEAGMVDISGYLVPAVDGFNEALNAHLVGAMRQLIDHADRFASHAGDWFEKVAELGYFDEAVRR
ncbi:MAG: DUF4392 domain-containing protein [Clostridiales bacterium]|nr:DUF4392 domain-containing protein [Clostridiales bacterium]